MTEKNCEAPKPIKNGRIECFVEKFTEDRYREGSRCFYRCKENYKLPKVNHKKHPGFIECRLENEKKNAMIWINELKEKFNGCIRRYSDYNQYMS